eukprot:Clim_evm50s119 gene=Clim_evmTU50s119
MQARKDLQDIWQRHTDIDGSKVTRPRLVSSVADVAEAQRWRKEIIVETKRVLADMVDPTLENSRIRELNEKANALVRERRRWNRRIVELKGPNFTKEKFMEEGVTIPEQGGYVYYGAAKELPEVKAYLAGAEERKEKRRAEDAEADIIVNKELDCAYYGDTMDDEEGKRLEAAEIDAETKCRYSIHVDQHAMFIEISLRFLTDTGSSVSSSPSTVLNDIGSNKNDRDPAGNPDGDDVSLVPEPTKEVVALAKKKAELLLKLS